MILNLIFLLISAIQFVIAGEYHVSKKVNSPSGFLNHISTIKLNEDHSYIYTDVAFDDSNHAIMNDTIKGEWLTIGDTLITKNYNVKWLVKKNSLTKLSVERLIYRKT